MPMHCCTIPCCCSTVSPTPTLLQLLYEGYLLDPLCLHHHVILIPLLHNSQFSMGFGPCSHHLTAPPPRPSPPPEIPHKKRWTRRPRPLSSQCNAFYWDVSSCLIKTACLSTFFLVESPRRIAAFVLRNPEVCNSQLQVPFKMLIV